MTQFASRTALAAAAFAALLALTGTSLLAGPQKDMTPRSAPDAELKRETLPPKASEPEDRPENAVRKTFDPEEIAEQQDVVLTSLFDRLGKVEDAESAKTLEGAIIKLWLRSGSATIDILMEQALESVNKKDTDEALKLLNAVVKLAPEFAEGWNKRATVYYMREDYVRSMRDIQKVLKLEPRHFGALAGLGLIMQAYGEEGPALSAFREALKYHPHLDGALKAVKDLAIKVEGRGI